MTTTLLLRSFPPSPVRLQQQRRIMINSMRYISRRSLGTTSVDYSVTIGDITVENPPIGTNTPRLIPRLPSPELLDSIPSCHFSHIRWMLQKDLILKQDFLLLGIPNLARERRQLLLLYASLVGREIEYMSLSKDTSEADLKQRKEVANNGTVYINQAPVRAAIYGRLLVLDGLEKAERNVLPTLNNLLENRELPLDDGTMLLSPNNIVRGRGISIHPDFRVAALGTISDDGTIGLDPPLRSRFQARLASPVDIGEAFAQARAMSNGSLGTATLTELMHVVGEVSSGVSLELIHNAVRYLERYQEKITPRSALTAHGISNNGQMIQTGDVVAPFEMTTVATLPKGRSSYIETQTTKVIRDLIRAGFESGNKAVAFVGPKGCYKSTIAKSIVESSGELFSLHPDITSRDLLQTRGTDENGNTIWRDTPLTRSARNGTYIILDGIDKLRSDTLSSIAMLLERGWAFLPDGTSFYVNDNFRCIAIAHPPSEKSWITPEIKSMFYWTNAKPLSRDELKEVLSALFPSIDGDLLEQILNLQEHLNNIVVDSDTEKESMQLSLRKLKHICRRVEQRPDTLASIVHNCLMTSFLPDWERKIVEKCLVRCGIVATNNEEYSSEYSLNEDPLLESCKRTPSNPMLVPNVQFFPNPLQESVMRQILTSHSVGERALLITGYQGVGKNKIVDHLLSKLNCEREYTQLHRDTTIQSLMLSPSVEDGRIVYNDSPLVRAAKNGRILILDEADKAPTEVVALLKGLIEDGQLSLPDGRVLCSDESDIHDSNRIRIHPDFRIWALSNPAVFPFQGNDLSRHMSDVFSCHVVPPMDEESHTRILTRHGEGVHPDVITKLVKVWEDLRQAHQKGSISYIFSVRESVGIVKHLSAFPEDGVQAAIENVLAFDRLDTSLSEHLNKIFNRQGIKIVAKEKVREMVGGKGGISTPKTRATTPKHGKEDPENSPHVGGNTWAGGTGGSDTAGLGGRGGPYRLDKGHQIYQISDEMKAQVSEEAKQRARKMANEALEKKLEELNMGKFDWERYNSVRAKVEENIKDMKRYLKDMKKRKEERQWLLRQTSGELDENRIVELLAGERDVFRRRGNPADHDAFLSNPMNIKLVIDVSASMYRFGYDGRLNRLLEATLMIMECFRGDKRFKLHIIGHNGSSPKIELVHPSMQLNEATQLKVLEAAVAHTQYTYAGDHTIEAIENAVDTSDQDTLVIVISDANLNRYDITLNDLKPLQSSKVHAHLIFIASLGDEASALARAVPNERAQCCFDTSDLPLIIKKIVTSALK